MARVRTDRDSGNFELEFCAAPLRNRGRRGRCARRAARRGGSRAHPPRKRSIGVRRTAPRTGDRQRAVREGGAARKPGKRRARISGNQNIPAEFAIGKRWTTRWITESPKRRTESDFDLRVTARENVTVPAGTFDCFKVEVAGLAYGPKGAIQIAARYWMAPDRVRQMIAHESQKTHTKSGKVLKGERRELVAHHQA